MSKYRDHSEFRKDFVEPAVAEFQRSRASLLAAFSAIIAIDSYLNHIAFSSAFDGADPDKSIFDREKRVRKDILSRSYDGSSGLKLVSLAANALKHGERNNYSEVVEGSASLKIAEVGGWSRFFNRAESGRQVVVSANADEMGKWLESGFVLKERPLAIAVSDAMKAIDEMLASLPTVPG